MVNITIFLIEALPAKLYLAIYKSISKHFSFLNL